MSIVWKKDRPNRLTSSLGTISSAPCCCLNQHHQLFFIVISTWKLTRTYVFFFSPSYSAAASTMTDPLSCSRSWSGRSEFTAFFHTCPRMWHRCCRSLSVKSNLGFVFSLWILSLFLCVRVRVCIYIYFLCVCTCILPLSCLSPFFLGSSSASFPPVPFAVAVVSRLLIFFF